MIQQGIEQSTGKKMTQTVLMLLIGQLNKKLGLTHRKLYRNNCSNFTQPLYFLLVTNIMTVIFRRAYSSWQFSIFWFENLYDWNKCSFKVEKYHVSNFLGVWGQKNYNFLMIYSTVYADVGVWA
jgi:hypothetical protein